MTDVEALEREVEMLKEGLDNINDILSDAETEFKDAFNNGYEDTEKFMDNGFNKIIEAQEEIKKLS